MKVKEVYNDKTYNLRYAILVGKVSSGKTEMILRRYVPELIANDYRINLYTKLPIMSGNEHCKQIVVDNMNINEVYNLVRNVKEKECLIFDDCCSSLASHLLKDDTLEKLTDSSGGCIIFTVQH